MFLAKNQNDGKVNHFFISGNEVKRKRENGTMNYPAIPAQTLKRSSINGVVFLFKRCTIFVKYVLMFFCLVIAYSFQLTSIRVPITISVSDTRTGTRDKYIRTYLNEILHYAIVIVIAIVNNHRHRSAFQLQLVFPFIER